MSILSKQKWLGLEPKKNLDGDEALAAVKKDGDALRYVENQTEAICMTAVEQDGWTLQFVRNQAEEICLAAVKEDGYALQYVRNQTEAICLAAVKENGDALRYVEERFLDKGSCDGRIVEIDGKKYKLAEL